jgi:hypothetical protein
VFRLAVIRRCSLLVASALALGFASGCSDQAGDFSKQQADRLFAKHVRCAALYAILENATKVDEERKSFSIRMESHSKIGLNISRSPERVQAQFDHEVEALYKQLAPEVPMAITADLLQKEQDTCVDAVTEYARQMGALPQSKG